MDLIYERWRSLKGFIGKPSDPSRSAEPSMAARVGMSVCAVICGLVVLYLGSGSGAAIVKPACNCAQHLTALSKDHKTNCHLFCVRIASCGPLSGDVLIPYVQCSSHQIPALGTCFCVVCSSREILWSHGQHLRRQHLLGHLSSIKMMRQMLTGLQTGLLPSGLQSSKTFSKSKRMLLHRCVQLLTCHVCVACAPVSDLE